jgi:hypothetical protein
VASCVLTIANFWLPAGLVLPSPVSHLRDLPDMGVHALPIDFGLSKSELGYYLKCAGKAMQRTNIGEPTLIVEVRGSTRFLRELSAEALP